MKMEENLSVCGKFSTAIDNHDQEDWKENGDARTPCTFIQTFLRNQHVPHHERFEVGTNSVGTCPH